MSALRRLAHRAARGAARSLSPATREIALALAGRTGNGPAVLPGPPAGPVLVVAPHPDDETIGCGGALARHAQRGDAITVLVATSGEATTGGSGDVAAARERECREACEALGLPAPVFLHFRDGELAGDVAALAAVIRTHATEAATVYVPSLLDPHPDHQAVNQAVAQAGLSQLPCDIYGYEVWSPASIDVVLDVTSVWAQKERALRSYVTALDSVDYVRACTGLASYRGTVAGLSSGYAEGFLRLTAAEHRELCANL